jgi:foldase protein PrsA
MTPMRRPHLRPAAPGRAHRGRPGFPGLRRCGAALHAAGLACVVGLAALGGCTNPPDSPGVSVTRAWQQPPTASPPGPARRELARVATSAPAESPHPADAPPAADLHAFTDPGPVLAIADGQKISRDRVVELLLRGHGVGVLEQFIALAAAESLATARGLTVTEADINAEYDRALRRLLSPLQADADTALDRVEGERLLEQVLASRNISRAEYLLGMRRNAYLRKIVEREWRFTDEQLEAEAERAYGERVRVRHLQVASLAEAERMTKLAAAPGADFADLARRYSANPNTAPAGGLLRVFSRDEEDVPALMRTAAFGLAPGQCSEALRIGEWYHVLKVEERIPAMPVAFADVRSELEHRLRERLTDPAMQQLNQTFLQQAQVEILDPALAEEYGRKHRQPNP